MLEGIHVLNRKFVIGFSAVTFFIAILLNYLFPFAALWMLFLLPAFGVIVLFPSWLAGNISALVMPAIRYAVQYAAFSGSIPPDFRIRLISTSIVGWVILLTAAFFILKLNSIVRKLEYLSLTDDLTHAFNRRYLELYSVKLLANSARYGQPLSFLLCDIDHFKQINDTHGHNAGDLVLRKLTQIIRKTIREADVFVRLGGEEFALFLPNTSMQEALTSAERIRKAVQSAKVETNGNVIPITISLGAVQYSGDTLEELIGKADKALYRAKANGRNQVAVWSPEE